MNLACRITAAVLILGGTVGCSVDEPREPDRSPSPAAESTADATADAHSSARPYAVRLALPEEPAGSQSGEGEAPTSLEVEVENVGRRADRYLLRVLPPGSGGVVPESFRLAPGERRPVRIMLSPSQRDEQVEVVAVSRGTGGVEGSLELAE